MRRLLAILPADEARARSWENERRSASTFRPPLRPALAASSGWIENARFSFGTLCPPRLAIAFTFAGSIAANPRRDFGFSSLMTTPPYFCFMSAGCGGFGSNCSRHCGPCGKSAAFQRIHYVFRQPGVRSPWQAQVSFRQESFRQESFQQEGFRQASRGGAVIGRKAAPAVLLAAPASFAGSPPLNSQTGSRPFLTGAHGHFGIEAVMSRQSGQAVKAQIKSDRQTPDNRVASMTALLDDDDEAGYDGRRCYRK